MKNRLKTFTFFIIVSIAFVFSSCLTDEEKEERTFEMELAELDVFLNNLIDNDWDIDTTDLGVYYVVYEEGEGPFPNEGDTLSVEYVGYFTDGNIFDASKDHIPDGIWTFKYLDPEVNLIPGMSDGLSLMNKGAEYDMIVTSNLAYGATGSGLIPPYTTLIFSVKMHDLKPYTEEP